MDVFRWVGPPEFAIAQRFIRDSFFCPEIFLPILRRVCNVTAAAGADEPQMLIQAENSSLNRSF